MDKLEQYLDQVCRGLGGARAMRQHVRQELREHLLDAVAGHRAAGLPEEQALARALEDFGGTEQLRSELEATHGHRLMPMVIDKAIEWKERTMKAKWLWSSWAHLALLSVIALDVLWVSFAQVFLVPRFHKLMHDGLIDSAVLEEHALTWLVSFLRDVNVVGGYTAFIILFAAAAWGLFEWRVRSENKSFMRLSALGTVAVALTVLAVLTGAALVIPSLQGAPAMGRLVQPFAQGQVAIIDTSVRALEQALAKKDWDAVQEQALRASLGIRRLESVPVARSLATGQPPLSVEQVRTHLQAALECLHQVQQACRVKDAERVKAAVRYFHRAFEPVRKAAMEAEK